jgi:hypothetical protein
MYAVLGKKQAWSMNETIPFLELLHIQEAHELRMSEKCVLGILRPMKRGD